MAFIRRNIIWVLFVALALGEIGYFVYLKTSGPVKEKGAVTLENIAADAALVNENPWELSAEIKAVPQPDISAKVSAPSRYPEFYRASMEGKMEAATTLLKETPYDFTAWASYAILLENFDAFTKAEEIWKYLVVVRPEESFYHSRLAAVYHFSLKDYVKAEASYKNTLALNNKQVDVYHSFHDLYKFIYTKDLRKAVAVIEEGLTHNKENLELLAIAAQDYRELGDLKKAAAYYTQAIAAATAAGNYGLVEQLKNDKASLK